jgi:RND family efflux transporter MFP subunit
MKKLLKSPIFWILLVFVIGVGFVANMRFNQARLAQATVPVERPPLPVRVIKAQSDTVQAFVSGEGTARAVQREFLNFEASGKVVLIGKASDGGEIREGSKVSGPLPGEEYGQLLAQLDQREILAALNMEQAALEQARQNVTVAHATVMQAETEYDLAKADFERFVRHSEEGTTLALHEESVTQARENVAAAEATVARAESDFKLASAELERTRKLSRSGATIKTYEEALAQAQQNVASAQAAVTRAENDYSLAQENFEKAEKLHKDGIIARRQYDEAKTRYLNAETALQTARANFQAAQSQVNSAENELEKAKINVPVTELATAQARYDSAEAALRTARANLEGAKSQVKTATTRLEQAKIDIPVTEYETAKARQLNAGAALQTAVANLQVAQAQVTAALARVEQAELNLERTSLFAPFDGVITYLNVQLGDYTTPQSFNPASEQSMMQTAPVVLIDPSEYEITLDIPAYLGRLVAPNQLAYITPSGMPFPKDSPERSSTSGAVQGFIEELPVITGSVYSVSPSISPGKRAIQIKIRTDDGSDYLQDGMFVTARIVFREKHDTVALPFNSMIFRKNEAYVFVVNPQTHVVTKRKIVGGFGTMQKQEILDGVEEGELVVTDGRYRLIEGMKVEILEQVARSKEQGAGNREQVTGSRSVEWRGMRIVRFTNWANGWR